jgi:hypothetical protein
LPQVSCGAGDEIQVDGLRHETGEEVKFLAVGAVHAGKRQSVSWDARAVRLYAFGALKINKLTVFAQP